MTDLSDQLKEDNRNLKKSLDDMHALRDEITGIMTVHTVKEVLDIYFDVLSDILTVDKTQLAYYNALSEDGPYELMLKAGGEIESGGDELPVDFEMIDSLNEQLKPVTFPHEKVLEVWIPMVRSKRIHGLTQVFLDDAAKWNQITEDRVEFFTTIATSALQSSIFSTELIDHSQKVEEQSAKFKELIEAVNVGLISIDTQHNVRQINKNASLMLRIQKYEEGQSYRDVFPREASDILDGMLLEVEEEGFVLDQLINVKVDEGSSISIGVNIATLKGADHHNEGYVLTLRDMTASKELDRLRKIDQMKSDFVNNVSHELRTPLTSIAAYTEALQGMLEEETHQNFLGVIASEADRLLSMIENLLNVSRIESGKMVLHKQDVQMEDLIAQVVNITKVQSDVHNVQMVVNDKLPLMQFDKDKIIEVFLNIVGNAIKYSPEGGDVTISVSLKDGNAEAAVSDQGIGLTPEDCQKVFDQFYRVDSSATATIGGTGLGLAITQSIVGAHGGNIKVSSVLGEGSTFTIILPTDAGSGSDEIELFDNDSVFS